MPNDKFLLIKAWSYILWMDVEHVLGQLLIAELTGRIPVVYWPTHCVHNGFIHTNGFELYFEPVSAYTVFDVAKPGYTYYPPIWDENNLLIDDPDKDTLIYRNIGDVMSSEENVLIGDVYFDLYTLIPFIKKDHPAYGMTAKQIYSYLFHKYIRLKQDIESEITGYFRSWLRDEKPVLAVHVCGVEKDQEYDLRREKKERYRKRIDRFNKYKKDPDRQRIRVPFFGRKRRVLRANEPYHAEIKKYIDKYEVKKLFLLTNSEETLAEYRKKYGDMLLSTDCKRATEDSKIKYLDSYIVKRRAGIETLKDTYLGTMCDLFVGNDFSSLSYAVTAIKDWPVGNAKLLYWEYRRKKYPINVNLVTRKKKAGLSTRFGGLFKKMKSKFA